MVLLSLYVFNAILSFLHDCYEAILGGGLKNFMSTFFAESIKVIIFCYLFFALFSLFVKIRSQVEIENRQIYPTQQLMTPMFSGDVYTVKPEDPSGIRQPAAYQPVPTKTDVEGVAFTLTHEA